VSHALSSPFSFKVQVSLEDLMNPNGADAEGSPYLLEAQARVVFVVSD